MTLYSDIHCSQGYVPKCGIHRQRECTSNDTTPHLEQFDSHYMFQPSTLFLQYCIYPCMTWRDMTWHRWHHNVAHDSQWQWHAPRFGTLLQCHSGELYMQERDIQYIHTSIHTYIRTYVCTHTHICIMTKCKVNQVQANISTIAIWYNVLRTYIRANMASMWKGI